MDNVHKKLQNCSSAPEERSAVSQFQGTFKRLPDSSHEVTIPRNKPLPELGESRLTLLITKFCVHIVAFMGDISKLFRGIHLSSEKKKDYHFIIR